MKLKKLASVAMAGVMAVSLAACGGSDTAKDNRGRRNHSS